MNYLLSLECKVCGWDWIGGFAYCPNCRASEVKILDYETMDQFNERMLLMEIRNNSGFFIIEEDFEF